MTFKKSIFVLFLLLINFIYVDAQNNNDYAADWKKVEDLEKKGLTKSALDEVIKIFSVAVSSNNEAQQIKAAMYQMKYRNMVEENNNENNIFYLDTLIAKTKAPAKNILQSMQAELFWNYKQNNRYKFYSRTSLNENAAQKEAAKDITTWSLEKLNNTITSLYKSSLQNENLLKNTTLNGLDAILVKGQNTATLRPTMYDFLGHRALNYFMSTENDVTNPSYKYILNDERLFAPVNIFATTKITTQDTASLYYQAILLLQDLLKFHSKDAKPDALIDADLIRLAFINEHGIFTHKEKLYESSLQNIETTYTGNPIVAQAMYLRAQMYLSRGQGYDPFTKKDVQYDVKKAKELAEQAVAKYPKSEGALNAQNLIVQINQPTINLSTEKVNVVDEPFRSLVKYKNISNIYLRIIKISRDELKQIEALEYDKIWQAMVKLKPAKSWSVALPDQKDFQEHATEIKIDALPSGTYVVLASIDESFSLNNNLMARQITYVSNISPISNNSNTLYILDRNNGEPLANADVQVWRRTYNYTTRKYEEVKLNKYISDKNGYIKIDKALNNDNYDYTMQVKYKDDELFTSDNYYVYNYNSLQTKETKRTFLFTDRSIYRPGQTIFFKGIVVRTTADSKKSDVVSGFKTTLQLNAVNGQKVATISLTTNDYGSYNGSFTLPEGLLNGQFSITDSATKSPVYFSVEEYKRPKFFVEIKKPEGSYKVNDSITVTGNAKAYAGNNIDGAEVKYRVVRKIQYPIWYGWGRRYFPQGNREQMEITNGTVSTDADGKFTITFKAIPDETVDKKDQPTFYYEVSADVTDINGETRSSNTSVAVSYQALQLDITTPDKLSTDSIKNIQISSTNKNGLFEKATVHVILQQLQAPNRIFRNRYWETPDLFVMTKDEYAKNFPYDVYADEDQMGTWTLGKIVLDITDTTAMNGHFNFKQTTPEAGWYKITVTTKDKYGEGVKAEKFIKLTNTIKTVIDDAIFVDKKNIEAKPGQKFNYTINTGFDKIWLVQNITKATKDITTSYIKINSGNAYTNEIAVTENDRGGVAMNYLFVQHNRIYQGTEIFSVPWNNKELSISYETFRDKILPGSEEKWTIKIAGDNAEKVAAEALISMYDASLDQFKMHNWNALSSLWPIVSGNINWSSATFADVNSEERNTRSERYVDVPAKSYDELVDNGWKERYYDRVYSMNMASGNKVIRIRGTAPTAAPIRNLQEGLVGKVSGLNIQTVNNAVLADGRITLRGVSSLTSDNHPLLIIDGKILELVRLSEINPDDIKEVSVIKAEQATALYGAAGVNGAIIVTTKNGKYTLVKAIEPEVKIRKNFNETAFFFPDLKTDANGNIQFSFTIPEALTTWKMMTLAHTKDLASAYSERTVITQKPLMVQPNAPRFLREGDEIEFSAKIVNLSEKEITGTSQLELFDAATNKPVDGWFKNIFPTQYFTVAAGQSVAVKFPVGIPISFNSAMLYRIKAVAKDGSFSDGEEAALPVLTNRMLVTETLPLNMRNTNSKNFKFEKLLSSNNSGSLTNHALTVEYTSNPAWYAVQALPYLMEYPYECAEQSFNRYYANALASYVSNSTPKIKAIFEQWKTLDTAALMSNLQKNEELKSALLQETPWVLQAKNEADQKKNIAILFDMVRLAKEKTSTLNKLKEMQSSNGGFTWFKGGPDDRYITQYIITGIGHLRKLNALSNDDYSSLKAIVDKALPYLDARLKDEYDNLRKYKTDLKKNNLSASAVQYLYMRSFFPETKVSVAAQTAFTYYRGQSQQYWLSNSKYMQAMIALSLNRTDDKKTPIAIIKSLKENAIYKEEMGMYFKEFTTGGYYWYQAPIESQAMMIEAFSDIDKNNTTVDDLKTWLLKQKQTQNWKTTKATAEACYALLLGGNNWLTEEKEITVQLGNTTIKSSDTKSEAGTGYFKQTIEGAKVQQGMGNITVSVKPIGQTANKTSSTSWGAVYWQYFEDLDKITAAETPLKLTKKLYVEKNSAKGPVLTEIKDGDDLKIGDKVKVRIELRADRDMEYIHMKDMRAACMEPTNVISTYKYQGGLGYYESTKDASTNFFFSWLAKGTYVFEYPMFVTHAGNYSNGVTTIQSMYAPEFSSHSEGVRVSVE